MSMVEDTRHKNIPLLHDGVPNKVDHVDVTENTCSNKGRQQSKNSDVLAGTVGANNGKHQHSSPCQPIFCRQSEQRVFILTSGRRELLLTPILTRCCLLLDRGHNL